ncbi:l-3-j2D3, partial [Drosophila busckii]
RFVWSPKSTNILLKLWEKNLIGLRDDLKKNSEIHKEMAMDMAAYGPTAKEIKTKMDNMLRKYRVEIEKMKKTNTTTSSWRYFKIIQTFLNEDPAADFEEIIFDDQESSTFYKSDECDDNISIVNVTNPPSEENFQTDTEPEPEIKDEHHSYPQLQRRTNVEEYHSPLRTAKKSKNRLMEIEEEKLTIEKQKLLVMKHISRDLTSISKTLIELLRNSNN